MDTGNHYRQSAVDCLRLAHDTAEPATRAVLTDMATAWLKLEEQGKKYGQTYEAPPVQN